MGALAVGVKVQPLLLLRASEDQLEAILLRA